MTERELEIEKTSIARSTDKPLDNTGIHTGEEIFDSMEEDEEQPQAGGGYARLVGMESNSEYVVLHLARYEQEPETIRLPIREGAPPNKELRQLYHYLGIDVYEPAELYGELVPINQTDHGLELDISIEIPPSNRDGQDNGRPDLSGHLGNLQPFTEQFRFWQGFGSLTVIGVLLLVLLFSGLVATVGLSTSGVLTAVVAQLVIAVVLVARSLASAVINSDE